MLPGFSQGGVRNDQPSADRNWKIEITYSCCTLVCIANSRRPVNMFIISFSQGEVLSKEEGRYALPQCISAKSVLIQQSDHSSDPDHSDHAFPCKKQNFIETSCYTFQLSCCSSDEQSNTNTSRQSLIPQTPRCVLGGGLSFIIIAEFWS